MSPAPATLPSGLFAAGVLSRLQRYAPDLDADTAHGLVVRIANAGHWRDLEVTRMAGPDAYANAILHYAPKGVCRTCGRMFLVTNNKQRLCPLHKGKAS